MRRILFLVVALLLTAGLMISGAKLLPRIQDLLAETPAATVAPLPAPKKQARVVVFTRSMHLGDVIDAGNDLTVDLLDPSEVPTDAVISVSPASDSEAKNRLDRHLLRVPTSAGQVLTMAMLREPAEEAAPEIVEPRSNGDMDFVTSLTSDPGIVFLAPDVIKTSPVPGARLDLVIETPIPSAGGWVSRETIAEDVSLQVAAVDLTDTGIRILHYVRVSDDAAGKVRALQASGVSQLKAITHGSRVAPPVGQICNFDGCAEKLGAGQ